MSVFARRQSVNPLVRAAAFEVLEGRRYLDATLTPAADTYVRVGSSATSIFGTSTVLDVKQAGTGSGVNRQTFLKFDLSTFTGTVSTATLKVYGDRSNTNDSTFSLTADAIADNSWTEAATNWNNKPAIGSNIGSVTATNTTPAWVSIDVSSYIAAAKAANQSTVSIAITGTAVTDAYFDMSSREGTNTPQLVVTTTVVAPNAPTGLTTSALQPTSVTLGWTDNSTTETGFQVWKKTGSGSFALLATTASNAITYTDPTLTANTAYSYEIIAINSAGSSSPSNVVNVTTPVGTTLTPTADTYVRDSTFATNVFGNQGLAVARISNTSTNNRQTYLKFDISGIGSSVSSATLKVWGYRSATNDSTFAIAAASMTDNSWNETTTDWNNKPSVGSTINTASALNTAGAWISMDVTPYIQAAKTAGQSTVSIAIVGAAATNDYFSMSTREGTNPPQLLVTLTAATNAAPTVATAASASPSPATGTTTNLSVLVRMMVARATSLIPGSLLARLR